jgi:uncharacterized membrane protein
MEPVVLLALLWALFIGTHIGLATVPVRSALTSRFGKHGFGAIYTLVAAAAFALVVHYYAIHRMEGPAGLALGASPVVRWLLIVVIVGGVVLSVSGLMGYSETPMAMFSETVYVPRGVERITRHPFFVGVAMLAIAHSLLATRLIGAVFVAGLAVLSIVGSWHQDRKLLQLRGRPYAEYLRATSIVPFAAIISGRQSFSWRELSIASIVVGLASAFALRAVHASIFASGGAYFIGATLAGAAVATVGAIRRNRRDAAAGRARGYGASQPAA